MLAESDEDHFNPSVRLIDIEKNSAPCGFHLTRGKWDPYPWVTSVDDGSVAATAGMRPGDCLLEVNGEDVVGQRISEIAEIVKSKPEVSLLLWNAGVDPQCSPEALCCGPLPKNLQRLSACMSTILAFLECPVCLDTIPPPTYQCDNGHLICIRCRTKSERCPVCRLRFNRGRSLLSDQVYNALIDAFNLREEADETRVAKIQQIFKQRNKKVNVPDIKVTQSHTNKFLSRIIGKSSSVDNLSSNMKLLSPNMSQSDNEFNSTYLKAKSLSTNEIFQSEGSLVSRSGSINRLGRKDRTDSKVIKLNDERPASYHGSFESLERKIDVKVSPVYNSLNCLKTTVQPQEDNVLFHCPFSSGCTALIKGDNIIRHFEARHGDKGPLVQYFSPNIKIYLRKLQEEEDICYVIFQEGNMFFLKVNLTKVETENSTSLQDILCWVWFLGTKTSKEYEFQVEIRNSDSDDVLLSVRSSVLSLSLVSLQEVINFKKGVFLSPKTLDALGFSSRKLVFAIKILKTNC